LCVRTKRISRPSPRVPCRCCIVSDHCFLDRSAFTPFRPSSLRCGIETGRIHVDKGYRGHNHQQKFRVWITGQVRRVTQPIRREMKRRAAVEPVIRHMKAEHRMDRNYLKGRDGARANAVLVAAGYNFALLLRWLRRLLRALIQVLLAPALCPGYL
jgi:hypothetical protein